MHLRRSVVGFAVLPKVSSVTQTQRQMQIQVQLPCKTHTRPKVKLLGCFAGIMCIYPYTCILYMFYTCTYRSLSFYIHIYVNMYICIYVYMYIRSHFGSSHFGSRQTTRSSGPQPLEILVFAPSTITLFIELVCFLPLVSFAISVAPCDLQCLRLVNAPEPLRLLRVQKILNWKRAGGE